MDSFSLIGRSAVLSVSIIVLAILSQLFKNKTKAKYRYFSWILIVLALLMPFSINILAFSTPTVNQGEEIGDNAFMIKYNYKIIEQVNIGIKPNLADTIDTTVTTTLSKPVITAPKMTIKISDIIFIVWLTIFAIIISFIFIRHLHFSRIVKRWGTKCVDKHLLKQFNKAKKAVKIHRKVDLIQGSFVQSPISTGFIRPVVIIPEMPISDEQLYLIFIHELLHIKNGDLYIKLLSVIASAIHWFNPLMFIMRRYINSDCEMYCDERVLTHTNKNNVYGNTIFMIAKSTNNIALSTAFSGNAKILKKRLGAIMFKSKPNRLISIGCASLILITALLSFGLSGCTNKNSPANPATSTAATISTEPEPLVPLTATQELVLYLPTWESLFLTNVVTVYEKLYPDVKVTVESFNPDDWMDMEGHTEAYNERLKTELSAGAGPDLIFMRNNSEIGYSGIDPYKAMNSGMFLDITTNLENDADFNKDDYIPSVIDSGKYNGRQFIIPYAFEPSLLFSNVDANKKIGLDVSKNVNSVSFINEMLRCLPEAQKNPNFNKMYNSFPSFEAIFESTGINLIDFEGKKVLPDTENLKTFCETIKPYFSIDQFIPKEPIYANTTTQLKDGYIYYQKCFNVLNLTDELGLSSASSTMTLTAQPSMDGSLIGKSTNLVGINANSKNQLNAYNFVKLLLDAKIQSNTSAESYFTVYKDDVNFSTFITGFPVHKKALAEVITSNNQNPPESYIPEGLLPPVAIPQELTDLSIELVSNISECTLNNSGFDLFVNFMTPYFNNTKSYDECLTDLESALKIYMSE